MKVCLLEVRNSLGLSQEQVAKLSGISTSTVNYIENGRISPKFAQIEALAKGLGVRISDIVQSDYY